MSTDRAKNRAEERQAAKDAASVSPRERSQPYAAELEDYNGETVSPPPVKQRSPAAGRAPRK